MTTILIIGVHAHAQSFDCGRASTAVEHAICSDKALRELDTSLAIELKDSMSKATPEQRRDLVWEERRWIAHRNKQCAPTSVTAGESPTECLAAVYRERIAYLKSLKSPDTSNCQKIADRYRPLASAHPGESPLSVVAASPGSGVTLAEPLARMSDPAWELPEWASKQTPPFIVPEELTKSLISMTGWTLEKLPNVNFYWLSSIGGTANCYDSKYFVISGGRAEVELAPPGFEDGEGAACGVGRDFGRIDDASVYLEENYNGTPRMSSDITVATWKDGGFHGACRVTFSFAPKFTEQTLNVWDKLESESWKNCTGTQCANLRRAAFDLVEAVQEDPIQARNRWQSTLSAAQMAEYETELKFAPRDLPAGRADQANVDPADFTDQDPFYLPYVYQGRAYVVSVGHFTIGWRHFADWRVTFESLEDGKLTPQGQFAVGMIKGELERVQVSAVH